MPRHINPGDPAAESRHIRAHPNYNGGDDCDVCKSWHKMRKHECNWRYYLQDQWGSDPDEDEVVAPDPEPKEPMADWELLAMSRERAAAREGRFR